MHTHNSMHHTASRSVLSGADSPPPPPPSSISSPQRRHSQHTSGFHSEDTRDDSPSPPPPPSYPRPDDASEATSPGISYLSAVASPPRTPVMRTPKSRLRPSPKSSASIARRRDAETPKTSRKNLLRTPAPIRPARYRRSARTNTLPHTTRRLKHPVVTPPRSTASSPHGRRGSSHRRDYGKRSADAPKPETLRHSPDTPESKTAAPARKEFKGAKDTNRYAWMHATETPKDGPTAVLHSDRETKDVAATIPHPEMLASEKPSSRRTLLSTHPAGPAVGSERAPALSPTALKGQVLNMASGNPRAKVFPVSAVMSGDISHIVTNALLDSNAHILLLQPSGEDTAEALAFKRIKDEVDYYCKPIASRVSTVIVDDSHGAYQLLVSEPLPGEHRLPAYRASQSTKELADRNTVELYNRIFRETLEEHAAAFNTFLSNMGIAGNDTLKVFLWGRSSGRHSGAHPESDTSGVWLKQLHDIVTELESSMHRPLQVVMIGDEPKTPYDQPYVNEILEDTRSVNLFQFWKSEAFTALQETTGLPSMVCQLAVFKFLDQQDHYSFHMSPRSGNADKLAFALSPDRNAVVEYVPEAFHTERIECLDKKKIHLLKVESSASPRGASQQHLFERALSVKERYGIETSPSRTASRITLEEGVRVMSPRRRYMTHALRTSQELFLSSPKSKALSEFVRSSLDKSIEGPLRDLSGDARAHAMDSALEILPKDKTKLQSQFMDFLFSNYFV